MNWEEFKTKVVDFLTTKGLEWGEALLRLVIILILGVIVIKLVMSIVNKLFKKSKLEHAAVGFIKTLIKFVLNLLLILIMCQSVGIPMTGLIALLSAAGLAVSLALQDSLSNLANGFVIISTRPFKEGDYVTINGEEGTIISIKMMYTVLKTSDGKIINIPNKAVVASDIVNYNANGERRLQFQFDVAYESDLNLVKDIVKRVILSNPKVKLDPAPQIMLTELNDSSVRVTARCWTTCDDYWDVNYYVIDNVFNEFKRENVSIPFPQMEVRLRDDKVVSLFREEPLPERPEPQPEPESEETREKKKWPLLGKEKQ